MEPSAFLIPLAVIAGGAVLTSLRILYEYERGVVFRLGKLIRAKGPGLIFMLPFGIERMRKMDLRIVALDIAPQDTITKDNVSVKVNAVVYFKVSDPARAVVEIEDYFFATSQLAQTTLRSVIGQSELDELLAERERINHVIRTIIDQGTDPWGIEVTSVEIKDIDLPKEMKRAMARQAEAERERRGKGIAAEGEFQASKRLGQAADVMARHPAALQLRYLQTLVEVAAENNSTTLFPIPIDIFRGITAQLTGSSSASFPEETAEEPEGGELPEPSLLPEGADRLALAEAARQALGLGSGRRERVRVSDDEDEDEDEA